MLKAIESKKHRGTILASAGSDADRANILEDMLTAMVFGRLQYLSSERICEVVRRLLGEDGVGLESVGKLVETYFWPTFGRRNGSGTISPDVVLEFENLILIVEAKRGDGIGLQSTTQLQQQFEAVRHEYERNEPGWSGSIRLLALGGHGDRERISPALCGVTCRDWRELWAALLESRSATREESQVVRDIETSMRLAGIRVRPPMLMGTLARQGIGDHRFEVWASESESMGQEPFAIRSRGILQATMPRLGGNQ